MYTQFKSGTSASAINLSAGAAFIQSIIGFVLVMLSNWAVRKINSDYALF